MVAMQKLAVGTSLFLLIWSTAQAHDFWIEARPFRAAPGDLVDVSLRVGEHFKGEPVGRTPERIARFVVVGAGETADVPGTEGRDPAGMFRAKQEALYVIGYLSRPSFIELGAADFEAYLREEGLDNIIELRKQRNETDKPAKETYSRAAKSLVSAGPATSGFDRSLDFPLEFIPESNPYAMKPGDSLQVRLLFQGKTLTGAAVAALSKNDPERRVQARTDEHGKASFRLDRPGLWMIKAVHMFPAREEFTDEGIRRADWESLWATLTFEVGEGEASK
jgi:uncharacterized GH25 family protein